MEFKVRWLGYEPEHDSWASYKNLAHTEQLILYLVRHRMRSLIPKVIVPDLPRLAKNKYLEMPHAQLAIFTILRVGLE